MVVTNPGMRAGLQGWCPVLVQSAGNYLAREEYFAWKSLTKCIWRHKRNARGGCLCVRAIPEGKAYLLQMASSTLITQIATTKISLVTRGSQLSTRAMINMTMLDGNTTPAVMATVPPPITIEESQRLLKILFWIQGVVYPIFCIIGNIK